MSATGELQAVKAAPMTNEAIDACFADLDTDSSGSLDSKEFEVYILGKYKLSRSDAEKIFKCNDADGNNTLDKEEFRTLMKKLDAMNIEIDFKRDMKVFDHVACAARWGTCGCAFCLCTVGCSCWLATLFATREMVVSSEIAEKVELERSTKIVTALTMEGRDNGSYTCDRLSG